MIEFEAPTEDVLLSGFGDMRDWHLFHRRVGA